MSKKFEVASPTIKTSGWVFEVIPPMGGPTGTAFSNTLHGTGDPSARLVREAIQNSTDAGTDTKVTVRFRYNTLAAADKKAFLNHSEIVEGFSGRENKLGFDVANVLAAGDQKPLGLLYIEDYQTTGLRGDLSDDTSDFHRLLLTIGDDQKAIDPHTLSGGSYGYGKAVLSSNSHIRTIFAYSLATDGKSSSAKLLGCSYCSKHDHSGGRYTGRGWFGSAEHKGVVSPFIGDDAHAIAERLGFRSRRRGEFGTSVLIVDCTIKISDLRREAETYWWPRLLDDELEVEFSENGVVGDPPRPKSRTDLKPFIGAYDMVVGRSEPTGKHQTTGRLSRAAGKELGRHAFEVLAPAGAEEEEEAGTPNDLRNRIAVMRKPKMIVAYLSGYTRQAPDIVGVFMADEGVDNYLKMSEPPDHTAWEASSGRLAKMKDQEAAVECIKAVHSRLRSKAKEFQATAMPPPAKKGARLTRLEQMLGAFFRTLGEGPGPDKEDPVTVAFNQAPATKDVDKKRKTAEGQFEIKLKNKFPYSSSEATIEFDVTILEDGAAGDRLSFELTDEQAKARHSFPEGHAKITKVLKRDESYIFSFITDAYDKQWSLSPNVKVTLAEEVPHA